MNKIVQWFADTPKRWRESTKFEIYSSLGYLLLMMIIIFTGSIIKEKSPKLYTYVLLMGMLLGVILIAIMYEQLKKSRNELARKNKTIELKNKEVEEEKERNEELLLNILPHEIVEELKRDGKTSAKKFDMVTVMFTDFKSFTKISEKMTPTDLVTEIDYCFKAFDNIIGHYKIEKIKTIGDSYMCAGGLPAANSTHAVDIVMAALEIRDFMNERMNQKVSENKESFEIRIGIHTGPVVAGVVGVKKYAYDIWGDTVNIASRMESSGTPGEVNISNCTYENVKDKFDCRHRGKIYAKNKGEIDMYYVDKLIR